MMKKWSIWIVLLLVLMVGASAVYAGPFEDRRADRREEDKKEARKAKKITGKIAGRVVSCDTENKTLVLEVTRKKKRKKVTKEVTFLLTGDTKVVKSKKRKLKNLTPGSKVVIGYTKEEGDVNLTAVWVQIYSIAKVKKEE